MRVMLVTDSLFAGEPGRGATTTTKAIADRLIDLGHEVRFLAPAPGLTRYKQSEVVRLNPLTKPGRQVNEAITYWNPDAVLVVTPGRLGRKALKHAQVMGIPTVAIEQHAVSDSELDYWRSKVAQRSDLLVVTSNWMADRLALAGIDARVWMPGIDTDAFSPALRDEHLHHKWSKGESLVVVGFAGRLANRHHVRRLVELNDLPGIRPIIIGDGPQQQWLRQRLPRAKFTGALHTGDMAVALASLDLFVHPGEQETCCHALREASASGVPIVAPGAGGALDVVRHLETGLLYEPGRAGALADAVAAAVADPQRALLGGHGREVVRARSWPTAVDELLAMFPVKDLATRRTNVA
ncbi:GDP-mannose-dependent alpha-mannosyltransferase [Nocardioides baekrokdamisoli]|uniref:GDP-mannose-dependent alpha-mannosyltransferase n=1 Tax=Nocardioides baekrokdamisoli TaxID=1804624 RepID=A0A3G9IE33_9ACTN|nr:glycosyltransferase [Nocardioides baekrokdamisoli]BBH16622.1 GDP-mannose-dependent alpha-mannosyltransferase [Nocardioides baekrokdamisoli]